MLEKIPEAEHRQMPIKRHLWEATEIKTPPFPTACGGFLFIFFLAALLARMFTTQLWAGQLDAAAHGTHIQRRAVRSTRWRSFSRTSGFILVVFNRKTSVLLFSPAFVFIR